MSGASKNTAAKLLVDAGKACAAYHAANVRNVKAGRIQVDEIWSFTYAKQRNVATAKEAPEGAGDTWTWTALDADSKLIVSYLVGGRDAEYAMWFMDDLAARLANRVQLTSDGHRAYLEACGRRVRLRCGLCAACEEYGPTLGSPGRYSPAEWTGSKKIRREGNPDIDFVSTSYVERQNLTMRFICAASLA
ncbi:hypothetical protein B2M20_10245 [Nitrobacter vulgaris]|uniref:DDE domain-containing protein n=1 Tax=Nitrobacter vulgaris TaxID=29421 RepID=A0A1V4HY49_NITVU|nr:hypothetical protein B2M20_10245 [Nitrobacter vulgaris]